MKQGEVMPQRDITFDIMKGIGILLVVAGHMIGWKYPTINHVLKSFRMPMFFLVAGYFTRTFEDWETTKVSLKRFFVRLLEPYAITQLFTILWAVVLALFKDNGWGLVFKESLSLFWADVFGPITPYGQLRIGVIWFLMALLVSKSIFLLVSKWKSLAVAISLLIAVVVLLVHKVFPFSIWCLSLGCMALPFVAIGWWVRHHELPLWVKIGLIVCWVVALFVSGIDMYSFMWKCYPLDILGACGGTYCYFLLCRLIKNHLRYTSIICAKLGVWSLAIMCVHCFELYSNFGNRLRALVGIEMSFGGRCLYRIFLTILLAIVLVHIPKVQKLFV